MQFDVSSFKNEREFCEFFVKYVQHALNHAPMPHQTSRELVYLRYLVRTMLETTDEKFCLDKFAKSKPADHPINL